MISEKLLRESGLNKKAIEEIKANAPWQQLEGIIEISIEVKSEEDLKKRLAEIAKQIIKGSEDIYRVEYKVKTPSESG